jgi:hypothetical protein
MFRSVSFKCQVTTNYISRDKQKRFSLWTPHLKRPKGVITPLVSCIVKSFNLERRSKCHDYDMTHFVYYRVSQLF